MMGLPQATKTRKKRQNKSEKKTQVATKPPEQTTEQTTAEQLSFTVRGRTQAAMEGKQFSSFPEALACTDYPEQEPIIEWRGENKSAALDQVAGLDIDHLSPQEESTQYNAMSKLALTPAYWWRTHGGGLRLIYFPMDSLTAHECAAIARLLLKRIFKNDRFEIKRDTRHPHYRRFKDGIEQHCGHVYRQKQSGLEKARAVLLGNLASGEVDPEAVAAWLEQTGLDGRPRFEHPHCPIHPDEQGGREPVVIRDRGIHCFVCEAEGRCFPGCSKAGFAPFALLIDRDTIRVTNHLRNAVDNFTHWAHARYIIGDEVAFRGLMKLRHFGEDDAKNDLIEKQIGKVFFPEIPIIRCNDSWMKPNFSPIAGPAVDGLIAQLPAVQYAAEMPKGGYKAANAPVTFNIFRADFDLSDYGYPNIIPLRGMDVAEFARTEDDPRIFAHIKADPPFIHRKASETDDRRIKECLDRRVPGHELRLIKLLIAAKGRLQLCPNDVPRIWIVGQSGAGKTQSIILAASICCDVASEGIIKDSWDRFIRSYADGSLAGSFVYFNEMDKTGLDRPELKSRILDFDVNKTFHRLKVGTQTIKNPAVVCLTSTMIPPFLLEDEQIARRFALVDLGPGRHGETSESWKTTCGAPSAAEWRSVPEHVEIADMIVSQVMRECFSGPGANPTFEDIVRLYGFKMLNEMTVNADDDLRRFYEAVINDPEWTGGSRWPEPDWRLFDKNDRNKPAMQLFNEITGDGTDLQPLTGAVWSRITGVPRMAFAVREHGRKIGFRFYPDRRGGAKLTA